MIHIITQDELRQCRTRNLIEPLIFCDEEWKLIEIIPDLPPIYWISNYGRVYNEKTGYAMGGHIVNNGYVTIHFTNIYGIRSYHHIHRLVMMVFRPILNPELYVVNHIDGIKTHNWLSNLEWVTQKENVAHAYRIGLRKCGENSTNSVFTNEQVHLVCKCMEDGMTLHELSNYVFNRNPDQQIMTLCKNIL